MASSEQLDSSGFTTDPILLSPLENRLCHIYDKYNQEGMGAMVVKVRGRIKEEPLRASLDCLQRRHPKLRAAIVASANARRYFHLAASPRPIPIEFLDCDADSLPWQEETHRRFSERMDLAVGPLARMLVLRSRCGERGCIIFMAHHAICDGLSLMHIVEELLCYYEEAERMASSAPITPLPFVSCPRARATGGLVGRFRVLGYLLRMRSATRRQSWTPLPPRDDASSKPQWDVHVFSVEETMALVRRYRKEKASLDGVLFAAVACALRALLPQSELRFRSVFPLDIRRGLGASTDPVTPRDLGCFVSGYEKISAVGPRSSFWSLAREAHRDIRSYMTAGGPAFVYNLIRLSKPRASLEGLKRRTLHSSVLGVAPLEKRYGNLNLEECAQVFKNDRVFASINLVAITVQLRLNLTMRAALDEDIWKRFRKELIVQLHGAMARGAS